MKPKDLLFQLSHLESHLNDFSLERLSADDAALLKKSFLSFKRMLLAKISPSRSNGSASSSEILKKNILRLENAANRPDPSIPYLDMDTYDAVIKHYESYGAILNSFKIDSAMKSKNQRTLIFNKQMAPIVKAQSAIDLNPMLEDCMGEIDLLAELIEIFERNALEFIGAAKIHVPTEDFRQLGLAAHKVKAGLAMMKADGLHSVILQVELACKKDKDIKHIQFLCNCFSVEFPEVQKALNNALETLKKNKR